MKSLTEQIRKISRELLEEGRVDVVVGFQEGTLPDAAQPCFVKNPQETDRLVWNSHCRLNLANYLVGRKEKIGVVAKGCDSRNIALLITENKIDRDRLVVIGVPCSGMADRKKLSSLVAGEITGVCDQGEQMVVKAQGEEKTAARGDLLQENCLACVCKNPVIHDVMAGRPVSEEEVPDRYADIDRIDGMTPAEKWDFFETIFSPCTRCYACKNACPLCYCPTCFVDESTPQWVGKGDDPVDIRTYHLLRAFHCSGRCTECGACEAACPMGIPVRLLTRKLNRTCEERFGHRAGMEPGLRPLLDTFSQDDPDDMFK